jgi:FkbM family methyltransferase
MYEYYVKRQRRKELYLRFRDLKFIVPKVTECFWPYYAICFVGEYDPILMRISSLDIVIDAGANIGIFTLLAAKKAKTIIAVEPDPKNFEYLRENVRLNEAKNVVLVNKALSNYVGDGFIYGRGPLKALSHRGAPVKVTTIDNMIKELGLDDFDVLKMDIEGAEVNALSGDFLDNVRELMVEVHDEASYRIIRNRLMHAGFYVKEWNFSLLKVLKRILINFGLFIDAELRTGFCATALALKYTLGLTPHPVPAAEEASNIKILWAFKSR